MTFLSLAEFRQRTLSKLHEDVASGFGRHHVSFGASYKIASEAVYIASRKSRNCVSHQHITANHSRNGTFVRVIADAKLTWRSRNLHFCTTQMSSNVTIFLLLSEDYIGMETVHRCYRFYRICKNFTLFLLFLTQSIA